MSAIISDSGSNKFEPTMCDKINIKSARVRLLSPFKSPSMEVLFE